MPSSTTVTPIEILLVEDNPGDVNLTQRALKAGRINNRVHVAQDGVEAMAYLHRVGRHHHAPKPDLVLLDLNMPRMNGMEVLADLKADDSLKHIPVAILTTSDAERDVLTSYRLHANCYITKPVTYEAFVDAIRSIEHFWLHLVELPHA